MPNFYSLRNLMGLHNFFQLKYYFPTILKEALTTFFEGHQQLLTFLHEIRSHADIGVHLRVHI